MTDVHQHHYRPQYSSHGESYQVVSLACACGASEDLPPVRTFDTGASRDSEAGKLDFEGFLSPTVLWRFAEYMNEHRVMKDGSLRSSDNWQKGIPLDAYMKSLLRHVMDLWLIHRGREVTRPEDGSVVDVEHALCAVLFNAQGYLHEVLSQEKAA